MEHIRSHIVGAPPKKKDKATERGELMQHFLKHLNIGRQRDNLAPLSMPRMGRLLMAIPTKDLYYLKSICDMAPDFSKKFWWEINPKKHTEEAVAAAALKFAKKPAPPRARPMPPTTRVWKRAPRSLG